MTEDSNKLISERRAKLAGLREEGIAFPNGFKRTDLSDQLQSELGEKDKEALEAFYCSTRSIGPHSNVCGQESKRFGCQGEILGSR